MRTAHLTKTEFQLAEYLLVFIILGSVAASFWRLRGLGIPMAEMTRVILGPTAAGLFWNSPRIKPLLKVPSSIESGGAIQIPTTPHELLRAISDAAERLTGAMRVVGTDAVGAARQLLVAIEFLSGEIAMLSRDSDQAEVARIEQRLMEGEDDPHDEDEQQMRMLLRRQLELLSRLRTRLDAATEHRRRLTEILRELWSSVGRLHSEVALTPSVAREQTEHIRVLCDVAEREASGLGASGIQSQTPASFSMTRSTS
jgi:hypothetical protein